MNAALPRRLNWLPLAAVIAVVALVFAVNPAEFSVFPPCLFHKLTGWNCPGCGATRAAHELLHGHLFRAVQDNVLFVVTLPLAVVCVVSKPLRSWVKRNSGPRMALVVVLLLLAFSMWRNLPLGAWWNP